MVTAGCPSDASGPGHICWNYAGEGRQHLQRRLGRTAVRRHRRRAGGRRHHLGRHARRLPRGRSQLRQRRLHLPRLHPDLGPARAWGRRAAASCRRSARTAPTWCRSRGACRRVRAPRSRSRSRPAPASCASRSTPPTGANHDLFVRRGEPPTAAENDCAAVGPSSYGACAVESPASGTWHVAVGGEGRRRLPADHHGAGRRAGRRSTTPTPPTPTPRSRSPPARACWPTTSRASAARSAPRSSTAPQHGALELAADGCFVYEPEAGYVGDDSFTYRASDGSYATSGLATLTVEPSSEAPGGGGVFAGCAAGGPGGGGTWLAGLALLGAIRVRRPLEVGGRAVLLGRRTRQFARGAKARSARPSDFPDQRLKVRYSLRVQRGVLLGCHSE